MLREEYLKSSMPMIGGMLRFVSHSTTQRLCGIATARVIKGGVWTLILHSYRARIIVAHTIMSGNEAIAVLQLLVSECILGFLGTLAIIWSYTWRMGTQLSSRCFTTEGIGAVCPISVGDAARKVISFVLILFVFLYLQAQTLLHASTLLSDWG